MTAVVCRRGKKEAEASCSQNRKQRLSQGTSKTQTQNIVVAVNKVLCIVRGRQIGRVHAAWICGESCDKVCDYCLFVPINIQMCIY